VVKSAKKVPKIWGVRWVSWEVALWAKDTLGSGLAVFAAGGLRPIQDSKIANGPVAILSGRRNGTGENAPNGIAAMGTTLKRTTSKRRWIPKPQTPRLKAA
jgi:hypothetical protein